MTTISPASALTGTLAPGGTAALFLSVATSAVPTRAPDALTDAVVPVTDERGAVVDWRLGAKPAMLTPGVRDVYQTWRQDFATERFIGELAFVRAFIAWAHRQINVMALQKVVDARHHADFSTALSARSQIDNAKRLVAACGDEGIGVFAPPEHRSAARALIPTDPPTTLLAADGATIACGPDGVVLHHDAGHPDSITLSGWQLADETAAIESAEGESIQLRHQAVLDALHALGRHSSVVALRAVPLRTLAAPMLLALREVTALAVSGRVGLTVRIGSS